MKSVTTITVSFIEDFVPFLRGFDRFCRDGRDIAVVYLQEIKRRDGSGDCEGVYKLLANEIPENWVSGMFVWVDSEDGNGFWKDVDREWRHLISREKAKFGETKIKGKVTLNDVELLEPSVKPLEPIRGKYYTVRDLSYNRPVKEEFENSVWSLHTQHILRDRSMSGKKYLVLSDYPEDKRIEWLDSSYPPKPMIKVWVPELNRAWWFLYCSSNISTE